MEESSNRPSGGAESQETFYRELSAEILHLAMRAGLLPARAADVAQSVCLKWLEQSSDFTKEEVRQQTHAWLLCVAQNEITSVFRRNRHRARSLDEERIDPKDPRGEEAEALQRRERECALLDLWIEELRESASVDYRLVFGHYFKDRSVRELARELGLSANTASKHLSRIYARWREWLLRRRQEEDDT